MSDLEQASSRADAEDWVLDDFADPGRASGTGTRWRCFTDQVMGGVSVTRAEFETVDGRVALHLRGEVSLANNGGFVQAALDLAASGQPIDVADYRGVALLLRGDGRDVGIHLRSADCQRPWQSYRAQVPTSAQWSRRTVLFTEFVPHRLSAPLDLGRLRRLGIVAIGEAGPVEFAVAQLTFFR